MDYGLMKRLFRLSCREADTLTMGTVAVRDISQEVNWLNLASHLVNGLARALDVQTEGSDLTTRETEKAYELLKEKYLCRKWTFKR